MPFGRDWLLGSRTRAFDSLGQTEIVEDEPQWRPGPGSSAGPTPAGVRFRRLPHGHGLQLPRYATEGAAGMDLRAAIPGTVLLMPGSSVDIPTGFEVALPAGHEGQVRGRSGLAGRHRVSVTHGVGTIDEDYRGEVVVFLTNHGSEVFSIHRGDRIAQMIVTRVHQHEITEVRHLDETPRGSRGYGSTGIA